MSLRLPLAVALILVAATVALGVELAGACSCAGIDARDRLAEGTPAVIGEVIARDPVEPAPYGAVYEYTVRVERSFNGAPGPQVTIRAGSNGGACGFTWEVGERVGAFLSRQDKAWTTNLCSLVDPAELEAATAPYPRARGHGQAALLAGGSFADARLMALDRRGRILGYGFGRGDVVRISVCPGSRRAAELVRLGGRTRAAVRDLRTLRVVRSVALPRDAIQLHCADRSGRSLFAAAVEYPRGQSLGRVRILRASAGRVGPVAAPAGDAVAFGPSGAYVGSAAGVSVVDLATGRIRLLRRLRHANDLAASPDGTRLAVSGARIGVRLLELPTGRLLGRARAGLPAWLGSTRLIVRGVGRPRLYDAGLRPLRRLAGFRAVGQAQVGRRIFGVSGRRLVGLDLRSGRRADVALLPDPDTYALEAVPGLPEVSTSHRAPGGGRAASAGRRCSAGDQPS